MTLLCEVKIRLKVKFLRQYRGNILVNLRSNRDPRLRQINDSVHYFALIFTNIQLRIGILTFAFISSKRSTRAFTLVTAVLLAAIEAGDRRKVSVFYVKSQISNAGIKPSFLIAPPSRKWSIRPLLALGGGWLPLVRFFRKILHMLRKHDIMSTRRSGASYIMTGCALLSLFQFFYINLGFIFLKLSDCGILNSSVLACLTESSALG